MDVPPTSSKDWLRDHPAVQEIKADGGSHVQENAAIAVYFDLTEVKQWGGVSVYRCHTLHRVYFHATHPRTGNQVCIVPVSTSTVITVQLLQQLFQHQPKPETTPLSNETPAGLTQHKAPPTGTDQLTLGLVDNEGTISYYHLQSGPPPALHPHSGLPPALHPHSGPPPALHPHSGLPPALHPHSGPPPALHPHSGLPPALHPHSGLPPALHPHSGPPPADICTASTGTNIPITNT